MHCVITYPAHVEEIFIEDPLNAHLHRRRRGRAATTCALKSQFNLRSEEAAGVTKDFRTAAGKLRPREKRQDRLQRYPCRFKIFTGNGRILPVRAQYSCNQWFTHHSGFHINPHDSDISAIRDQVRSNLIKHLEACDENKLRAWITGKPIARERTFAAIT